MNYISKLKEYCEREIAVINNLNMNSINQVMNILETARLEEKNIFIYTFS